MRAIGTALSAAALIASAAAADPAPSHEAAPADLGANARLHGKVFAWALAGRAADNGQCREEWRFGTDGLLTVRSGEETVTKQYRLETIPNDPMHLLRTTLLSSDGKPDCKGDTYGAAGPPIGRKDLVHVQFLNDGSFFTCGSTDGLSCYGVATPRLEPAR